ncbi:hypothetical protein MNBD_GAMMA12-3745 [hydrothermal vent metagenome]|uniref:Uncharacterized protein n=1 Tax=hydrothermal vent metagenome TaxID=652676 RepID=A0A3B0XZV9_9ZZZZ
MEGLSKAGSLVKFSTNLLSSKIFRHYNELIEYPFPSNSSKH